MSSLPSRSWVEISRRSIAANFRAVRDLVGPRVEVMPVVKADAYRHGAVEVSRILLSQGARWLAVSSVEEAIALREAGAAARILVMAGCLPPERQALLDYDLTPVIHSLDELRVFDQLAASRSVSPACHLKIDTGLGRLGTLAGADEILAAIRSLGNVRLEGLMTHLATSADYSSGQTEAQMAAFDALCAHLRHAGFLPPLLHVAATIPVAYGRRQAWYNMVRPGHAIYGYVSPVRGPAPPRLLDVKPALSWKAAILEVKDVPEGALIGYGGMFRAPRPLRIGILAVGYADGFPHRLSNKGKVIADGRLVPILGAVSMDLATVDLTAAPSLRPGDSVTLLGAEGHASIGAQQIARAAGTISYSVLCGISPRVKRLYV